MSADVCPCCGRLLPSAFDEICDSAKLTNSERRIFMTVAAAAGEPVARERLFEKLWGGDPDGGPISADNNIKVFVHRANVKLEPFGCRIEVVWGFGYRFIYTVPVAA